MPRIHSINTGLPEKIAYDGKKTMITAIAKKPVSGRIYLDLDGFEGDGTADKRFHGGGDKAVCVYSMDHFPYWEKELSKAVHPGAFGENLTLSGIDENNAHLGDRYKIGAAEVEVSQARMPCHKLNKIFDWPPMACRVRTTGFSGFYMRVIKPGYVESGNDWILLAEGEKKVSIAEVNRFFNKTQKDKDRLLEIMALPFLAEAGRKDLTKLLKGKVRESSSS